MVKPNQKSDKPSLYLIIDFGEKIGKKKTSAQLTKNYLPKQLVEFIVRPQKKMRK